MFRPQNVEEVPYFEELVNSWPAMHAVWYSCGEWMWKTSQGSGCTLTPSRLITLEANYIKYNMHLHGCTGGIMTRPVCYSE